mgnify:CR=1 FL=1
MAGAASKTHQKPSREPILVDLALQGGGSHGAFTWGVLDRLLEDERIDFEGVAATSAERLTCRMRIMVASRYNAAWQMTTRNRARR